MFSPEALKSINETYEARPLSKRSLQQRAARDYDAKRLLEAGETEGYLVDGTIYSNDELAEQFVTCETCGGLCRSEPLTWGVQQWRMHDESVYCNTCYATAVLDAIECGKDEYWPVQGDLEVNTYHHALEHRALKDALTKAGWEVVYEGGGDTMTGSREYLGKSISDTYRECCEIIEREPARRFVITVLAWQFCADVYLWRK